MSLSNKKIAFIGSGNMARSLVSGLIQNDFPVKSIWVSGRTAEKKAYFSQVFKVNIAASNIDAVKAADVIVLCVKPYQLQTVCEEIKSAVGEKKPLIISIAAGVTTTSIANWLDENVAIVRTMPNMASAIASGATGLFANKYVNEDQHEFAESLLRCVGLTVWVENEGLLDSVTALSGSGPAYVFLLMEAMQSAGEKLGLSPEQAELLTKQTLIGASRMALESEAPVAQLRQQVTSKGGTTEQAIATFETGSFSQLVEKAMEAAFCRAGEISEE